jgi:hypothetical protein|eukprot:scaffold1879_cov243-Chaetoceros_neogracile.AAC.2
MTVVNIDGSDVPIKNKRARVRMSITCVMQDIGIFSLVVNRGVSMEYVKEDPPVCEGGKKSTKCISSFSRPSSCLLKEHVACRRATKFNNEEVGYLSRDLTI